MTKTQIYAVLLAGTICISLAGCGNTAPVSESETVQIKAEETADETSGIDISDVVPAEPTVSEEPEPPAEASASEPPQPTEKEKPEAEPASEQTEPPVQTEPQKPAEPAEPQQPQEPPAAQTQPPAPLEPEPAQAEPSKPTEPAPQEPQPTPPEPQPAPPEQTPEEAKPKTAYDYEFDIEAIKADCIGIGQSMGLTLDSSLTPDNASWWNPVTASSGNQGEALKQSLASYITFHTVENLNAYGIDEITSFNICCEARGNGAYAIYFLFA